MNYSNEFIVPCKVEKKGEDILVTIAAINFTPDGSVKNVQPIETLSLDEYHTKYCPIGSRVKAKKRVI